MLKLADLRKTTRRTGTDGRRVVYPTFLRDRSLAPRIELAVRYLESMLGRPRRDLDQEVVVQLFGDHKLARCVVACLAVSYRHQSPAFADVLPAERVAALADGDLRTPSDLRLWVYARANSCLPGFVSGAERAGFLSESATPFGLDLDQIESLLTLDAPARGILVRTGPVPTADDVIARFNHQTVMALLASASLVRLSLRQSPADRASILALCERAGVHASLAGRDLVLQGQQDTLGGWARHGARLARLLATLLVCGLPVRTGEALIAAATDEWLFRLDTDALGYAGMPSAGTPPLCAPDTLLVAMVAADRLIGDFAAARRAGDDDGWRLRRAADPLVADGLVIPSLLMAVRGNDRAWLVPPTASGDASAHMRQLAARQPLLILDPRATRARVNRASARPDSMAIAHASALAVLSETGRAAAAALPGLLTSQLARVAARTATVRIEAVFNAIATTGVLTESRLAERLGCVEDEVPARLATPEAVALREARGIRYVEGFGLCAPDVLARARAAAEDVAGERAGESVGHAWTIRVLGRRLREVTGASEGIECLIAYLGAA